MLRRTNAKGAVAATLVFINVSVLLNGTTMIRRIVKRTRALYPITSRFGKFIVPTAQKRTRSEQFRLCREPAPEGALIKGIMPPAGNFSG